MKKIIIFIFLLCNGQLVHCQQMFTNIPHRDYAKVYEVVEIDNYYYFMTRKSYYDSNNVLKGGTYIYKTDINGTILDSLLFTTAQLPGIITIGKVGNQLAFYTTRGSQRNMFGYAAKYSLGRMRYDANFNFVDSFIVDIPQSAFSAGAIWYSQTIKDRIVYIIDGNDTTTYAPWGRDQDRIFVLDTVGTFLFYKALDSLDYEFTDITTTNDGENFILRLFGKYRMYDDSLNEIKAVPDVQNLKPGFDGLDKYSNDKFTVGCLKGSPPMIGVDSFCVSLLDTSFNLLRQACVPYDSLMEALFPNSYNAFDTRWYDGRYKNSIYIGNNWGSYSSLLPNSYFTLTNLDSNLNIRWTKLFGGDYPYQIERYTAVSDGGCFIMGIRRLGNNSTDPVEPVVFKISQQGVMTSITSFAPSAQADFELYPNPGSGVFYLEHKGSVSYELMVFNQEGKIIHKEADIATKKYSIDLSQQAGGVYFYKVFTRDGKSAGGKLVVR